MADISAITLPDGNTYNFADAEARESITTFGTFLTNSASTNVPGTGVSNYANGASVSLTAGTWLIIGQWQFNARASGTANANLEVNIYDETDTLSRQRINVYGSAVTIMQTMVLYKATTAKTVYVRGGSGASIATACANSIWAIRLA